MIEIDGRAARRLVFAVTLSALQEARRGDQEAVSWLMGDALPWLESAGLREITSADMRAAIEDRRVSTDKRGQKCYW